MLGSGRGLRREGYGGYWKGRRGLADKKRTCKIEIGMIIVINYTFSWDTVL